MTAGLGAGRRRRIAVGAVLGTIVAALLAGCAAPLPASPAAGGFDLERFFDGRSYSSGTVATALVFEKAFTASFEGSRHGRTLELDEHFVFPDGRHLQHWHLSEVAPGRYHGTVATGLDGGRMSPAVPVDGHATPHGVVLDYDGYAPGGGETVLHFRHQMTALADGTVANQVTVSKFGMPLATSKVIFAKSRAALAGG